MNECEVSPPIAIEFDKQYAEESSHAWQAVPIPGRGPGGSWQVFDMLLTAGACVAGALSHRPALQQPDLSPEQQADSDQAYIEGTLKAVGFISHLVFQVMDDEYDDQFEPRMMAIVRGDQVIPTEGWR